MENTSEILLPGAVEVQLVRTITRPEYEWSETLCARYEGELSWSGSHNGSFTASLSEWKDGSGMMNRMRVQYTYTPTAGIVLHEYPVKVSDYASYDPEDYREMVRQLCRDVHNERHHALSKEGARQ